MIAVGLVTVAGLVGLALILYTVLKVRPTHVHLRARVTRWCSFELRMRSEAGGKKARGGKR
jgi:hypothetical protein